MYFCWLLTILIIYFLLPPDYMALLQQYKNIRKTKVFFTNTSLCKWNRTIVAKLLLEMQVALCLHLQAYYS